MNDPDTRGHDSAASDAALDVALDAVDPACAQYELTLYVSGASDLAGRAIANARRLCETYLVDRYHLLVVDVHEDPAALIAARVLATPTLVKSLPLPVRRIVGDLSQVDKVLSALDVDVPIELSTARGAVT